MLASLQATLPASLDHEIILIDDGSTDGTREWLKTLTQPPFKILFNDHNLGYGASNNRAASFATGEFLILLNNDLVLTPRWLEPMLALQATLPKPGAIGNIQLNATTGAVDHAGIYVTVKGKPEHEVHFASRAEHKISPAITAACLLISQSLWLELGGFDPQFRNGGEDVDLCFRARAKGRTNAVALRSVIRHHISASPGRKEHDERNAYHLTLRWKQVLITLGARAWCRHLIRHAPYSEIFSLPAILLYLANLRSTPPAAALQGVEKNINHSLSIWTPQFGG